MARAAPIFLIDNKPMIDIADSVSSIELFRSAESLKTVSSKIMNVARIAIQERIGYRPMGFFELLITV